jgi:uncharacterized protein YprB with RNaseH-like and TPR domain
MLKSTYIFAQGVGNATERKLWRSGAVDWDRFLADPSSAPLNRRTRDDLVKLISNAQAALERRDASYFAKALPQCEHWRAIEVFDNICYLDIETDGLGSDLEISVIGTSNGYDFVPYIQGQTIDKFVEESEQYDVFVTFFGGGFDIPTLKRVYPTLNEVFENRLHVDLCPALKRLGFGGGLKKIEKTLGIDRVPEAQGLSGFDAVRLWRIYRHGGSDSAQALETLIAYNREDVMNMKTLLEFALPRLRDLTGIDKELAPAMV